MSRQIVASICDRHGFHKGSRCPECELSFNKALKSSFNVNVNTDKWISQGEYEHIDPAIPHMRFDSKNDLKRECEKRGLLVKCLMKPKSASKGFEHAKR